MSVVQVQTIISRIPALARRQHPGVDFGDLVCRMNSDKYLLAVSQGITDVAGIRLLPDDTCKELQLKIERIL